MGYVINTTGLVLGVAGIVSLVLFIFVCIFFGRLIKHQWKVWLFAKRGYTQIRHVREDKTERYFFLRIKDEHYDFDSGIHMEQLDTRTKTKNILAELPKDLLSDKPEKVLSAEDIQIKTFLDRIRNSKVMDINTLSWGIPTITYYGDNPNPVNYGDIHSIYSAKNIACMIKRIMMTKEWKLVRMALIVGMIGIGLSVIIGFLDWSMINKANENLAVCLANWNSTQAQYTELLNTTKEVILANATVTI